MWRPFRSVDLLIFTAVVALDEDGVRLDDASPNCEGCFAAPTKISLIRSWLAGPLLIQRQQPEPRIQSNTAPLPLELHRCIAVQDEVPYRVGV